MRKLTMALALILSVSAYAEMEGTTTDTATETMTTTTNNVSNLNYFVGAKKFNIDTTVGLTNETTEIGSTETKEDGLEFGLTGLYGWTNTTNVGFRVGYTSVEDDSSTPEETTGLNDIDLLFNWRFANDRNAQQDLNFTLSPKLGAKEDDNNETNGYRGSTLVSIDWVYNSKINTNTEWNVTAGLDYYTAEETENAAGTVTEDLDSRTDFGVIGAIRHHANDKVFVGGTLGVTLPGDLEDSVGNSTIEIGTLIGVGVNAGYKINRTSNVNAEISYTTASADSSLTTADIDITGTNLNVAYVREF